MKKLLTTASLCFSFCMAAQFEVHVLNIVTNDLAYEPVSKRLFASVGAANGPTGNSLGIINLTTHSLTQTLFIGSEPTKLALSDDGAYLYSAFDGTSTIRRVNLNTMTPEQPFTIGSSNFGPFYAEDIAVMPGNHDVVSVSRKNLSISPRHGGVAVFDNGTMRSVVTQSHTGSNCIQYSNDPNWLFGYNNETTEFGLRRLKTDINGITEQGVFQNIFGGFGADFIFNNNKLYTTTGHAIDVTNAPFVEGKFFSYFSGQAAYDPSANLVCYAIYNWQGDITFKRFNPQTFLVVDSLSLPVANGSVKSLVNCGPNYYALNTTDNKVILIHSSPVGIKDYAPDRRISFYPNPTKDYLFFSSEVLKVEVMDLHGSLVIEAVPSERKLDLSTLPKGLYYLRAYEQSGQSSVGKLIKQ